MHSFPYEALELELEE